MAVQALSADRTLCPALWTTHAAALCFLAGPSTLPSIHARHRINILGGQGMNTGIQDAYNLAWKLALVASGAASDFRFASSMCCAARSTFSSPI